MSDCINDVEDVHQALELACTLTEASDGYWAAPAAIALAGIVFAASPKGSGGGLKRAREFVATPELWPAAALNVRQRESIARVMSHALDRLEAR